MTISPNLVRRFQETHKRKFGEYISEKEAEQTLINLKELVRAIAKEKKAHDGK